MPTGRSPTAAALLVLGALAAVACSPPRRSETEQVHSEPGKVLDRFSLTAEAPVHELERPADCAGQGLAVTLVDRSGGAAKASAYLLTVEALSGEQARRVLAFTPYPVGSDSRLVLPAEACAGDKLRFAVQPVAEGALAAGTRLDIAIASIPTSGG